MNLSTHIVAAAGFVINTNNEILMVKDNRKGWLFLGGIVENGETITEALIREVKEETGIDIEVDKLISISSNISEHPGYNGVKIVPTKVMFDFSCKSIGGNITTSEENSETAWFKMDNIYNLIQAPEIKERFKAYLNYNNQITYLTYKTHPTYNLILKSNI
jgi:8-oxo-dGTP diphosphatase